MHYKIKLYASKEVCEELAELEKFTRKLKKDYEEKLSEASPYKNLNFIEETANDLTGEKDYYHNIPQDELNEFEIKKIMFKKVIISNNKDIKQLTNSIFKSMRDELGSNTMQNFVLTKPKTKSK